MPDNLTPDDRKKTMRAVKSTGTKLERQLAAMLAGMRIKGWKKNRKDVIGNPDIVFFEEQIAIFVDGCFWHGCQVCKRKLPVTNKEYWEKKITRNQKRSDNYDNCLAQEGWKVIHIWEHEIANDQLRKLVREKIRLLARTQT